MSDIVNVAKGRQQVVCCWLWGRVSARGCGRDSGVEGFRFLGLLGGFGLGVCVLLRQAATFLKIYPDSTCRSFDDLAGENHGPGII